jgi:RNA polymerase sigma-70 factor (ECF subfamily)
VTTTVSHFERSAPSRHAPDVAFPELLAAAQRGAGWAFERLHHDHARHLEGFLRAQRDPDPAATTAEAFRRAFLGLPRFSGDHRAFRSWVFTIARNLRIENHRAAAIRPTLALVPSPPEGRHRSHSPARGAPTSGAQLSNVSIRRWR